MSNKAKIIILILVVCAILFIAFNIRTNNSNELAESDESTEEYIDVMQEVQYDEETGEYYIIDEANGVIYSAPTEEELYPPTE